MTTPAFLLSFAGDLLVSCYGHICSPLSVAMDIPALLCLLL